MPPPTAADEWLAGRRFGIVIDAGSSGSRLQIYSWRDARVVRLEEGQKSFRSLPKVEKGSRDADGWVRKVEPGISSFGENPEGVAGHLAPLLEHARSHIPPSLHAETSIFLYATAGMRLLTSRQQSDVIDAACSFLKFHSDFRIDSRSLVGPCGSSIRIISGEEEGLFGWISVNYLMDQFTQHDDDRTTFGFLDMGGASTQIAFEPSPNERRPTDNLMEVRLRLIGGEEVTHQVFVTTWLGYGTNQARERYISEVVSRYEYSNGSGHEDGLEPIPDPCLPRNLNLSESLAYSGHDDPHSRRPHSFVGTGSFEQCIKHVGPLLNKDAPCPDVPCLFNGIHVPHIDFSVSHFIGVSEYWYSSEHVFGLGGAYNFVEFEKAASQFCSREWEDILQQHQKSKEKGTLGGDGEVEVDGKVVELDKWGDEVEIPRLQMQCFKSAWLVNVLHDGIGMPRIVDPGGRPNSNADDVEQKADEKGLGKPLLQSVDVIGDTAISWTLGKMVLEASREVPPLPGNTQPIQDPTFAGNTSGFEDGRDAANGELQDIMDGYVRQYNFNITLSDIFLYFIWSLVIVFITYRLRRSVLKLVMTCLRSTSRVGSTDLTNQDLLEDGQYLNGRTQSASGSTREAFQPPSSSSSLPLLPMRSYLTKFISFFRPSTIVQSSGVRGAHHMHAASGRSIQSRSFSSASSRSLNGSARNTQVTTTPGSWLPQRSSTPPVPRHDALQGDGYTNQQVYSLPRSRNNSQMNLTMLVPRQPLSKSGSGQQTPTGGSFEEGE